MASEQELAERRAKWLAAHGQTIDIDEYEDELVAIIEQIAAAENLAPEEITRLLYRVSRGEGPLAKDQLVHAYRELVARGVVPPSRETLARLRTKPIRTLSGVAPVTVLTKPFPCPGECIFCPEFAGMPKSYIPDEPGALRAGQLQFDPYLQTALRIRALENIGHNTDKVELLILGGTWSYYPPDYQEWFIRRCLDAMNGEESATLEEAQRRNETASHRNVGLVIETRPDYVDAAEVTRLRRLGVTKVQIGVQSLDDDILLRNKRGHTVEQTRQAFRLLRAGGFKIHAHWMPNLLGATPQSDLADFSRLWDDPALRPDELKIYPCSLIADTELYHRWERGEYRPYTDDELVDLVAECKTRVPPYCRINRVMRDIPAEHVAAGSTLSNLRQVVHRAMKARGPSLPVHPLPRGARREGGRRDARAARPGLRHRHNARAFPVVRNAGGGARASRARTSLAPTGRIPAPVVAHGSAAARLPGRDRGRGDDPRGARLRPGARDR